MKLLTIYLIVAGVVFVVGVIATYSLMIRELRSTDELTVGMAILGFVCCVFVVALLVALTFFNNDDSAGPAYR